MDLDQDSVLIIMDTEGLNSVRKFQPINRKGHQYRLKDLRTVHSPIVSFHLQFVNYVLSHRIGHIDEKALENMSYVLRISENLKVTKANV